MIIERKQYSCITLLFIQVGLAVYTVVLFLAPAEQGHVRSTVLSVQKIAEIDATTDIASTIESISTRIHLQLLDSGYRDIELHSVSAISESDRRIAEDQVADAIIGMITTEAGATFALPSGITLASPEVVFSTISRIRNTSILSTTFRSLLISLESIGISPRAPAVFA